MRSIFIKSNNGFSAIEILIVISIFILLSALSLPFYNNLHVGLILDKTQTDIVQSLRLAKTKSMSWENNLAHGVYFSTSSLVLYQGNSYAERDSSYDHIFSVDDILSLDYDLSSNDINFIRGTGAPLATGTIQILNNTTSDNVVITINNLGVVDFSH